MILLFWLFFWWGRAWYGKIYFIKCEQKGVWVCRKTKETKNSKVFTTAAYCGENNAGNSRSQISLQVCLLCDLCDEVRRTSVNKTHFLSTPQLRVKKATGRTQKQKMHRFEHRRWIIQTILSHVCRQNEMNIWFVISGWSGISHYCHTARPNYHSAFQLTVFSLLTFFCVTFHTSACRRASFEFCFLWNIKLPDARKHLGCNDTSIQSTIVQ